MATRKEITWCTIIGAIGGAAITYFNTDKSDKTRWLKVFGGAAAGAAGGYIVAGIFGEPADTINYSGFDKNGKRVYEGICYDYRRNLRITEHKANGKKIERTKFDQPKPRSEAKVLEKTRIKKFRPKYNVQHNSRTLKRTA